MRETGSRPVVGSSRKKMSGLWTSPRADLETKATHTTGESLGGSTSPLDEVDGFQDFIHVLFALTARNAVELGVDEQVFVDGKIGVARESLRYDAYHAADSVGILYNVVAANDRVTRCDRDERGHHADQRAFARAIWTEQSKDFAFGHFEADTLDRFKIAVAFYDLVHFDGGGGGAAAVRVNCRGQSLRTVCGVRAHGFTILLLST